VYSGDGAVIGTNSKVVRDVRQYSFVGGNPAIEIKKRFADETIENFWKLNSGIGILIK